MNRIYRFESGEYEWDLYTSELDDNLYESIKELSSYPNEIEKLNKDDYEYAEGFRFMFNLTYNLDDDYDKWGRAKNLRNHRDRVTKLLHDNGYSHG